VTDLTPQVAMSAPSVALPRSCPRCTGRLFHGRDAYGGYSSCVLCGFVHGWVASPAIELPEEGTRRRLEPNHGKLRL
jgi:hypothetical protein